MVMKAIPFCASLAAAALLSGAALAKGDLAIKAEKMEPLELGSEESDYAMSVEEYHLETGRAYEWEIASRPFKDYALVAPDFFRNIWIRKLEVGNISVKAPVIDELEFEGEAEAELFFVPIRPGFYEFRIKGLEERGMVGRIIVK